LTSIETIRALAEKWLDGTITPEEEQIFETWYNREKPERLQWLSAGSEPELKNRMFESILHKIEEESATTHKVRSLKTSWIKYAAAIIILFGISTYLWNHTQKEKFSLAQSDPHLVKNDISPGNKNAVLTLADGSRIALDSFLTGIVARQGSAKVNRDVNGRLVYSASSIDRVLIYNTVTVPRGSQVVQLTLADGTRVWLNAASEMKYPVVFLGKDRRVEIAGEAYFEVAKDASKPFTVENKSDGLIIEVLGTHFNVNAYNDESTAKVTLLEGSVRMKTSDEKVELRPGQQGQLEKMQSQRKLTLANAVDINEVMAWKNGLFLTGQEVEITSFLKQVARWYDVDIQYKGSVKGTVGGVLPRQVNVSKVLQLLESTGSIRYQIKGKEVIVSPYK
jgi:transmembrane sensor